MNQIRDHFLTKEPVKWVFYGDSITHGAAHTVGWRDYTELFSERIRFELYRTGDIVIKSAFDGNTTRQLIENFDWRVGQFQPQVVFIMIGMNDCTMTESGPRIPLDEFRRNLRKLIKRVRDLGGEPVLQTSNLLIAGEAPERIPTFPDYMTALRDVAKKTKCPLIDHSQHWQQLCEDQPKRFHYWLSDSCHPNEMGHRVLAHFIFQELGIFDPKSAVCRLLYL